MRQVISGTVEKPKIGKSVKIQADKLSEGNRIWYSSADQIIMASYVSYGQNLVFEDDIFL